jgi:ribonuclease P protein component
MRLTVAPNRGYHTHCGIVVGKRIGGAVQRNRAKRRVREAIRLVFHHLDQGVDLVFFLRTPDVSKVSFSTLQATIEQLLRRAGVWLHHAPPRHPDSTPDGATSARDAASHTTS